MAPGIGGNGGGGRHTGTVPKTKSHNESSRDYNGTSRRDVHSHFNLPNNLSLFDWQPVNESITHSRTRKESNTSASRFSESFDTGEDNTVSQDNHWFNTAQRPAYNSDDDEVSQASWAENGFKSNNLGVGGGGALPDKTQVAGRLHQIREYVSQTMSLMDGLRSSGGQRNMVQHEKLASMLEGLRDSEIKLQTLYERLDRAPTHPEGEPEGFPGHQVMESPGDRSNKQVTAVPKTSEAARRNELKKQVYASQMKLQELQDEQTRLKMLRQRAIEQLNEAKVVQGRMRTTSQGMMDESTMDNMTQKRLQTLQLILDPRVQMMQEAEYDQEISATSEAQKKMDELEARRQQISQQLFEFSNFISHNNLNGGDASVAVCEMNVENQVAEQNVMRDIQSNIAQPQTQERAVKAEPYPSVDKSNSSTSQSLRVKSQQLEEAKSKLMQLQTLLQTVEEMRSLGQPLPESLLQSLGQPLPDALLQASGGDSEHGSSSPTHLERSDILSMDLNTSHPASERTNNCERSNYTERGCRSLNSCERERVNQQPTNASKHNNQEGKLSTKIHLDEFLRNQDMHLPPPLQSSSFQEPSIATGTWGGSTQSTLDDPYMPEYSGDMNESSSVKNLSTSQVPHNNWRKLSVAGDEVPAGSGASRDSWTSPYVPRDVRHPRIPQQHSHQSPAPASLDMPVWKMEWNRIHQEISQVQNELRQMSGMIHNKFVEKQHNCPPPVPPAAPWGPPNNMSAALGPYCQYIASVSQWQQQQLLVHSLNQCCQLIWHQQRELAALKEALRLQPVAEGLAEPVPVVGAYLSDEPQPGTSAAASNTPHSNLSRHSALKPSLSAGPTLAPPTVVTSAHSLPNLVSSQPSPSSPATAPPNNRNLLSLPPTPNPNIYFADPNFINLYPPYGNNLNFEFPSPVNFFPHPPEPFLTWASQSHPPTTLNNQVPPGNRANNYWDNFRSYSRQNLLSNSGKSNDGIPQRTPLERFFNTDAVTQPSSSNARHNLAGNSVKSNDGLLQRSPLDRYCNSNPSTVTNSRSGKERLNYQSRQRSTGEAHYDAEDSGVGEATGYQSLPLPIETKAHARQQQYPNSFQNVCNDHELRSARLVNENEPRSLPVPMTRLLNNESESGHYERSARSVNESESRRVNNDCEQIKRSHPADHTLTQAPVGSERKAMVNKRNFMELQVREAKISQLNNYHMEQLTINEGSAESSRPLNYVNGEQTTRPRRQHPRNVNSNADCGGGGGECLRGARRKDNKANVQKECRPQDINGCGGDSLEDCVYSEVAALISANECRPQFLLQLFKDLRLLAACPDTSFQATSLSSIHALAVRSTLSEHQRRSQEHQPKPKEEPSNGTLPVKLEPCTESSVNSPHPRNWPHKEIQPQLPSAVAKLDWEVRSILLEMLPFIKCQLGEPCGPPLLESLRRLILHLVPSQATQDQLDAQLEDALHKFHGCRLGDVYEELLTVVADVLISELTFLRLVNTVHHQDQPAADERGEPGGEAEVEEGAVGGILVQAVQGPSSAMHPTNQIRRIKSEAVSEADLAEADQLRHSASGGEDEERGDTVEGFDLVEEDGACAMDSANFCAGNAMTESKTEACWAVEEDRELGLDQVPTRLHNPPTPATSPEESLVTSSPNPNPESNPI